MEEIIIGSRKIDRNNPVFIIAEAGINHNGDIDKAKELVVVASEAGADAIKFQTHLPDKEMLKNGFSAGYIGESFYDLLSQCQLSEDEHRQLQKLAEEKGIIFFSTPFSREAADFLETLNVFLFKTGSGELTNLPLLLHIAHKQKPMIISTGMSELEEIDETVNIIRKINDKIILMQCTSTYPTEYKDVNLNVIELLQQRYSLPVGLSDHSRGIYTALAAVTLGAVVIEKHFTIDRNWSGPDQAGSIEPHELKELVIGSKAIKDALGSEKRVIDNEKPVQKMARESVVSIKNIPKGSKITQDMIWIKRPGTGIPAKQMNELVGKVAKKGISNNTLIMWDDLEE